MVEMGVKGKILSEVNTGASLSIIDEKTWHISKGSTNPPVEFAGMRRRGLHVFKEASHSLCGRDMIRKLRIDCGPHYGKVHEVKRMPQVEIKREIVRILGKNKKLFQEGLCRSTTARAELKFKGEVHNEWVTTLVAPKPGGKIRICGDYKGHNEPATRY
ncbi:hypothetical protein COOONC_15785 [Cooperia oncophora]